MRAGRELGSGEDACGTIAAACRIRAGGGRVRSSRLLGPHVYGRGRGPLDRAQHAAHIPERLGHAGNRILRVAFPLEGHMV